MPAENTNLRLPDTYFNNGSTNSKKSMKIALNAKQHRAARKHRKMKKKFGLLYYIKQ